MGLKLNFSVIQNEATLRGMKMLFLAISGSLHSCECFRENQQLLYRHLQASFIFLMELSSKLCQTLIFFANLFFFSSSKFLPSLFLSTFSNFWLSFDFSFSCLQHICESQPSHTVISNFQHFTMA